MANNLFTQEDFIKTKNPQKKKKNKYWFLVALGGFVIATIFVIMKCTNNNLIPEETAKLVPSQDNKLATIDTLTLYDSKSTPNTKMSSNAIDHKIENKNKSNINIEQMAWSVIRGSYDNNPVRRQKLGKDYQVIQDKVNELYRKGLVH